MVQKVKPGRIDKFVIVRAEKAHPVQVFELSIFPNVPLGTPFMRQIDKGLANSRIGIVLVTPAFLKTIANEGVADKELSVLLARDLLIPIAHNTTFDALREVSPMLGSRNGLSTEEDTLTEVAAKIAELVQV